MGFDGLVVAAVGDLMVVTVEVEHDMATVVGGVGGAPVALRGPAEAGRSRRTGVVGCADTDLRPD